MCTGLSSELKMSAVASLNTAERTALQRRNPGCFARLDRFPQLQSRVLTSLFQTRSMPEDTALRASLLKSESCTSAHAFSPPRLWAHKKALDLKRPLPSELIQQRQSRQRKSERDTLPGDLFCPGLWALHLPSLYRDRRACFSCFYASARSPCSAQSALEPTTCKGCQSLDSCATSSFRASSI